MVVLNLMFMKKKTLLFPIILKILKEKYLKKQAQNLELTKNDILVFRDLDFINKIKFPELYDKCITSWKKLNRLQKQNIVMHYIDNIELIQVKKKLLYLKLILEIHSLMNLKNYLMKVI